jgi:hypothetical protein
MKARSKFSKRHRVRNLPKVSRQIFSARSGSRTRFFCVLVGHIDHYTIAAECFITSCSVQFIKMFEHMSIYWLGNIVCSNIHANSGRYAELLMVQNRSMITTWHYWGRHSINDLERWINSYRSTHYMGVGIVTVFCLSLYRNGLTVKRHEVAYYSALIGSWCLIFTNCDDRNYLESCMTLTGVIPNVNTSYISI